MIGIFFSVAVAATLTFFVYLPNHLFKLVTLWRAINWPVSLHVGIPVLLAALPGPFLLTKLFILPPAAHYTLGNIKATIEPVKLAVCFPLVVFANAECLSGAR